MAKSYSRADFVPADECRGANGVKAVDYPREEDIPGCCSETVAVRKENDRAAGKVEMDQEDYVIVDD